jgi:hypothetical protein
MTTISVVSAIWGSGYCQFVDRWWASVAALERTPDQVVVITDQDNFDLVQTRRPLGYDVPLKIVALDNESTFNDYWDAAFRECDMDWIATCCIDDVFVSEALNDIDRADEQGCEMVADGVRFTDQSRIWKGYWNPVQIFDSMTMPGAAPMRKDMYERVGGFPKQIYWSDWAFYMVCAKAGVKVFQSDLIRIIFDEGYTHKTQSGQQLDSDTRQMANHQIRDFAIMLQSEK